MINTQYTEEDFLNFPIVNPAGLIQLGSRLECTWPNCGVHVFKCCARPYGDITAAIREAPNGNKFAKVYLPEAVWANPWDRIMDGGWHYLTRGSFEGASPQKWQDVKMADPPPDNGGGGGGNENLPTRAIEPPMQIIPAIAAVFVIGIIITGILISLTK